MTNATHRARITAHGPARVQTQGSTYPALPITPPQHETQGQLDLDIRPNGSVRLSIPLDSADPTRIASLIAALQARVPTPTTASPSSAATEVAPGPVAPTPAAASPPPAATDIAPGPVPLPTPTKVKPTPVGNGFVFPDRPRVRSRLHTARSFSSLSSTPSTAAPVLNSEASNHPSDIFDVPPPAPLPPTPQHIQLFETRQTSPHQQGQLQKGQHEPQVQHNRLLKHQLQEQHQVQQQQPPSAAAAKKDRQTEAIDAAAAETRRRRDSWEGHIRRHLQPRSASPSHQGRGGSDNGSEHSSEPAYLDDFDTSDDEGSFCRPDQTDGGHFLPRPLPRLQSLPSPMVRGNSDLDQRSPTRATLSLGRVPPSVHHTALGDSKHSPYGDLIGSTGDHGHAPPLDALRRTASSPDGVGGGVGAESGEYMPQWLAQRKPFSRKPQRLHQKQDMYMHRQDAQLHQQEQRPRLKETSSQFSNARQSPSLNRTLIDGVGGNGTQDQISRPTMRSQQRPATDASILAIASSSESASDNAPSATAVAANSNAVNSAHEMFTDFGENDQQIQLNRRSLSVPEFHQDGHGRTVQYARGNPGTGPAKGGGFFGARAEELEFAWREVEHVRGDNRNAANHRGRKNSYRRLLRGRTVHENAKTTFPGRTEAAFAASATAATVLNPENREILPGSSHEFATAPLLSVRGDNSRFGRSPEDRRQANWDSPTNMDPRAGVSPRRRILSSISASLVRLKTQHHRSRPGMDTSTSPTYGAPPEEARTGLDTDVGIKTVGDPDGSNGAGASPATDSSLGSFSKSTLRSGAWKASGAGAVGASEGFAEGTLQNGQGPSDAHAGVPAGVSDRFSLKGMVSKTTRVNGSWLEFIVLLSVDTVVSETAQMVRDFGHDVWRRPGERKLRCTAQPEAHGPPMYTTINVVSAVEGRGAVVRLRRARADRHQTMWWRYVSLHRELVARFDAMMTPTSQGRLGQTLRIEAR